MLQLGVVRGISYGLFGRPENFGPAARALNAGLVRAYVYWNQVEPEPGRFDWAVVDRLLDQVSGWGRLWLTVCSSSQWATRTATSFLPPSPPLDPAAYRRFVAALVERCAGAVDYWQCENEPSNEPLLWAGTAAEYAELLAWFAAAVRAAPGAGKVVLGGIGYDALSAGPDSEARAFYDAVLHEASGSIDVVDVHLYDDPARVADHLAAVRGMLEAAGCPRPLVVGEFGGPTFFEFPAAEAVVQQVMLAALSGGAAPPDQGGVAGESPDRQAMRELYRRRDDLPADLQQFLDGASPDVAARRDRIACREVVTRALSAFAAGASAACYWNLAPEVPDYADPYSLLGLSSAHLALLNFHEGGLADAQPAAATFRMLADALRDAVAVERITLGDRADVHAVDVVFPPGSGRALQVLWLEADPFTGDGDAREAFEWQWVHDTIHAANAFAEDVSLPAWNHGRLAVPLSATPVLLSATPLLTRG